MNRAERRRRTKLRKRRHRREVYMVNKHWSPFSPWTPHIGGKGSPFDCGNPQCGVCSYAKVNDLPRRQELDSALQLSEDA